MPSSSAKSKRVAIVGASSLRGKELKLVLEERNFPADDIVLLDEPALAGTLTEAAGEPTFIRALEEDSFEDARFVFFTGSQQDAARNWPAAQRSGATVIDLSGALAASGESTSWIPLLDTALLPRPGLNAAKATAADGGARKTVAYSSPGSGVIIACTLAAALAKFSPLRTVLLLFPPVSERDQAAVDELEAQTTNLLSFRPIVQPVFDAQVAFNLLAGYGPESKPTFAEVRNSIAQGRFRISRRPRAGSRHSVGASAGLLRICFRRVCRICCAAVRRATPGCFQQSRCEGWRAGRSKRPRT